MADFSEFLNHEEEVVRDTAKMLQELVGTYQTRFLKKEEVEELASDLLDMAKIENLSESIERKANIEKAFNALKLLITTLV